MPIDPALLYDDNDIRLRVAAHVLAYMADRDVTQNEVARRAGLGSGWLSRFITGERTEVPVSRIMRLAQAIESSPSVVLREPPPAKFYEDAKRRASSPPTPRAASRAPVQAGKQRTGGRR